MAAATDVQLVAVGQPRSAPAASAGAGGQCHEHVQVSHTAAHLAQDCCTGAHLRQDALVHVALELGHALLGRQDASLELLQAGRDEALGRGQRLAPLVVARHQGQIRPRDFEVIAKDLVEANLQRADASPLPLGLFELSDLLAAGGHRLDQAVQLGVVAGADSPSTAWRCDGAVQQLDHVRARVQLGQVRPER